jgi:hypothetical protein
VLGVRGHGMSRLKQSELISRQVASDGHERLSGTSARPAGPDCAFKGGPSYARLECDGRDPTFSAVGEVAERRSSERLPGGLNRV